MSSRTLQTWPVLGLVAVLFAAVPASADCSEHPAGSRPAAQSWADRPADPPGQREGFCGLKLVEHRTGRLLARVPLDPGHLSFEIHFVHSVHSTPVLNRYVWRRGPQGWRAHLIEERFQGEGYGLATAPAAGETLTRVASPGGEAWQLTLDRPVDPLVVRALPAQQMRVSVGDAPPVLLGKLTPGAVHLQLDACDAP